MKSLMLAVCIASITITASASQKFSPTNAVRRLPNGMSLRDYVLGKKYGGMVIKPKSGHGEVQFVNAQTKVPASEFAKIEKSIKKEILVATKVVNEAQGGQIVIEIVDRAGDPTLAIYPDDCKATVNIAALSKDGASGDKLAARMRKEVLRAFVYLAGEASTAGCEGALMDAATDMARLDAMDERVPGDLTMRAEAYLLRIGIKPYLRTTYQTACQEGWAPQPTNDFQKAVWDKVYTMPDKPIKIEKKK